MEVRAEGAKVTCKEVLEEVLEEVQAGSAGKGEQGRLKTRPALEKAREAAAAVDAVRVPHKRIGTNRHRKQQHTTGRHNLLHFCRVGFGV